MPKSVPIRPEDVRRKGQLEIPPIPLNQYDRTIEEEAARRGPDALKRIYRDMALIRAFESMLSEVKLKGAYRGVAYEHRGRRTCRSDRRRRPWAMAFALTPDDHIFGSHRSHGEILAKGLSAIRRMSDEQLLGIMRSYGTAPFSGASRKGTRVP
jgi:2-oxoisovalerate dehydrogenase E1 component